MSFENIFIPEWKASSKVRCLVTQVDTLNTEDEFGFNLGRNVGDAPEAIQNRCEQLVKAFQVPESIAWLNQVRGNRVIWLDDVSPFNFQTVNKNSSAALAEADGSFTFEANKVCVVSSADCLPIFLSDQSGQFVAALHAGWQGLYSGIIQHFFEQLSHKAKELKLEIDEINAYFCPAISKQNYQVGNEFKQRFVDMGEQYSQCFEADKTEGKFLADIKAIAKLQLAAQGVENITDSEICTYADHRFYSHRRATHENSVPCGRFVSMIWLQN